MKKRTYDRRVVARWRRFRYWIAWRIRARIWRGWLRHMLLAPFGRLRNPRPLIWNADADAGYLEPECPNCGEVPYSESVCYFCGQRFTDEAQDEIW